jgi:hypothetical protein
MLIFAIRKKNWSCLGNKTFDVCFFLFYFVSYTNELRKENQHPIGRDRQKKNEKVEI